MDLAQLWYGYLELPVNALTIVASIAAVIYWIKLFKKISISGRQDEGWLWVFASVLMVLMLNVSTLLLIVGSGRVPLGMDTVFTVDVKTLEFVSTFSRAVMAVLLTVGSYMLYQSIKDVGEVKFVFTPIKPAAEVLSMAEAKYDLEPGKSYLVREGTPNDLKGYYMHSERRTITGIELFKDLVTHGKMGLCVTRKYPPKVREENMLMKTPMIWLTQDKGLPEGIHPSDLAELSHMMKDFIMKGGDTVVLLEGSEYLILHNSFPDILKTIQGLDDVVVQNRSRLIVTVDPSAITEQQYHLLSRELIEFNP